jgi:hypothetical protein
LIWDIKPFTGLGPVSFSMTPEQVASTANLGPIVTLTTTEGGSGLGEFRGMEVPIFNYQDAKLVVIGTTRSVKNVRWNDIDIYASKPIDVLQALERANGGATEIIGTVVFEKFGLHLTGFYMFGRSAGYDPASDEQDDRGMTVWDRAAQQETLSETAEHIRRVTFL